MERSWKRVYETVSSGCSGCSTQGMGPGATQQHIDSSQCHVLKYLELTAARFSLQKQFLIATAIINECLYAVVALYSFGLSCFLALGNLVVLPVIPLITSSILFWKDSDWCTWMSTDHVDYWKNKVAWVTGASSGVGSHLAHSLAKRGVSLILSGRNVASLEMVKSSIVGMGYLKEDDILVLCVDFTKLDTIPAAVNRAIKFKNKVNLLFNNAGVLSLEPVSETSWATTMDVLYVNLLAPIRLTQELLPHMESVSTKTGTAKEECHVIFTNSIQTMYGLPCHSAYATSKQGVVAYARSLAGELRAQLGTEGLEAPSSEAAAACEALSGCGTGLACRAVMSGLKTLGINCTGMHQISSKVGDQPNCDISVTTVFGGRLQTDFIGKRLDSRHARVAAGLEFPKGAAGKTDTGKPMDLHDSKRNGMTGQRFAELMLVAVSNKKREAWIGKMPDLLWACLMSYAPDLGAKLARLTESTLYRKLLARNQIGTSSASQNNNTIKSVIGAMSSVAGGSQPDTGGLMSPPVGSATGTTERRVSTTAKPSSTLA